MSPAEALTITALGLIVVFTGLVLCLVCMVALERVARRITGGRPHGSAHSAAAAANPAGSGEAAIAVPVPPDVLAVIVAVLEVERALYVGRYRSRLTLRRPGSAAPGAEKLS
jgi:Na+-transporting methylmalonyl-CoA/oxaloacetate decarboxylase gamma subunit